MKEPVEGQGMFEAAEETAEQFMATKPWIGALVAPTNSKFNLILEPPSNPEPPNKSLKLSFINGFKVEDSRQNMYWSANKDQIIYPAAAVGVVMNSNTLKQKFMGSGEKGKQNGHTDDIMALGITNDRKTVVTGSLGARPEIIVWNASTMEVRCKTNLGRNTRVVSTIRFSEDSKYFFCTDKGDDTGVYVFDAMNGQLLGQNKCGGDPVFDADCGKNGVFACASKRGTWFFQFAGGNLTKKRGIFGGFTEATQVTITYDSDANVFYSGNANGELLTWSGTQCSKQQPLHLGAVMGLAYASGKLLSSGAKDNLLKVSVQGQVVMSIPIPSYAKSLDLLNGSILCATKCGKVLVIPESTQQSKQIMQGHWCGETWGLGIAANGMVYTSGDDNYLLEFNPKTTQVTKLGIINSVPGKKYKIGGASTLSLLPPNQQARAIAVNKAGHVAIGCNDGYFSVRTTDNLSTQVYGNKIAKEWIEVIKYSPTESRIAVGSHDNNIYILNVQGSTYTPHTILKAHQSFITNLDWSLDGTAIQSNCGAYELLFFNAEIGRQITSGGSQFKDEKWATYTVKLGWYVQGIFPPAKSGNFVNGVDRSKTGDIIITSDDDGMVNLYRNPALKGAQCKSYKAHSSHVVRALFDPKEEYIYSVGGYDKTLMMWKYN